MKLLALISNVNGHLIVLQQPQSDSDILSIVLILVLTPFFIWKRMWKMLVIPAMMALIIYQSSFVGQKTSFRVEVDQARRQIISEELDQSKVLHSTTLDGRDLGSAEMPFNRGVSRIVLIRRDGHLVYPLGEQHLQDEPDQYIVLNATRGAIGQFPTHP